MSSSPLSPSPDAPKVKRVKTDYELRFYLALKRILLYDSPARLRRHAERQYGLTPEEAMEMAYENIKTEAKNALQGYRNPTRPTP